MDATPVPCGHPVLTARRSGLYGWAGYGYCPSHSRWYWGSKLLFICTCEGTVTGFGLANPKLFGEREQARLMLERQPAPGTAIVTDKGGFSRPARLGCAARRRSASGPWLTE